MFKLLVAESEYEDYLRLTGLTDLEKLGVDRIDRCADGAEALEQILREEPDAVLTAIDLPGLDGLELIRRCREAGCGCDFVVVSRHRRFHYAQYALRLGAVDYLTKPVNAIELKRVVSAMTERRSLGAGEAFSSRLFLTRRALRNSFMAAFTSAAEPEAAGPYSLDRLNRTYHFNLREGAFRTAIIALHRLPETEKGAFLPALVRSVRARFDPLCHEMIPYIRGEERLTLTFNYSPGGAAEQRFSELSDLTRELLRKQACAGTDFSIGLGAPETDVKNLRRTLDTAERALRCRLLRGENQLFDYTRMKFDAVNAQDILTPTLLSELRASVERLDAGAYRSAVGSAFASVSAGTDGAVVIDILHAAVDAVWRVCGEAGYLAVTRETRAAILEALEDETTLPGTRETLCRWASEQFSACKRERQNSRPVRAARRYIQTHYMEPLTLEQIAGYVHLNASYFSIIFKKQTGQNFSDFLTECRVEAAKTLLRDTDLSVSAVCEAVGYLDRKYFSRTFTKLVGIRPSAYRTLHG